MFDYLKKPRDITKYTLMRGVTDFGNLNQYNLFETGYSFLTIVSVPKFLETLAAQDTNFATIFTNYLHILEYEFRGLDGLEDVTSDSIELTNGISQMNVISKVNQQSASQVSMRYFEKSGSVLTRVHETFLKGIKDPRTQFKHYHGLIDSGKLEGGYENEVFSFLYGVTDNTGLELEKAYLLISAQPTKADTSEYNSEKGEIGTKEITCEFNCFPITGNTIDSKAKAYLDYLNTIITKDSSNFGYTGIEKIVVPG